MRVLHVIPAVAARYGGPGVVAVETVRALRVQGIDALIATTDADGRDRLRVTTGEVVEWAGVPAVFQPLGGGDRFKWSGALSRWLAGHVHEFDVVDIHAIFSHSSIAAGRQCRLRGVPYVVRPHGALDPWSLTRKAWRKRVLMRCGVRQLLAGAAFVQYTTAAEQAGAEQRLRWLPPGRVIPLGADDRCFVEPSPDDVRPYVLALSRLESKKSLDLLIDAFHDAATGALATWRLVIAGDGEADYVARLRRRAADGPAGDRIEFPGWVDGESKRALLTRAALFACPSAQENFGLALVEAMAAGVPVVVTPGVNLSAEIGAAGAGRVAERERSAIAAALRGLMTDAARRAACGKAARRLADQFRWRHSAAELAGLYESAIGSRRVADHA